MPQTRIPRISTRGYYDLGSGKTLKKKPYDLYPRRFFAGLGHFPEFTIMVHGLRNNKSGALAKFRIAQKRLRQLGYKYPVVGFSYDSNVKGVQYKSCELKATKVGKIIARKNGKNLAKFILEFKKQNPETKIRLMGHSLGTEVILYTLVNLRHKKEIIESVYFFGSSIPSNLVVMQKFRKILKKTILHKIVNYYSSNDKVLKYAHDRGIVIKPIGYFGIEGKTTSNYVEKKIKPYDHRFASYSKVLTSLF